MALVAIHPPWDKIAGGFVPQVPSSLSVKELLQFSYFGVAILSAVMFPYEAYFYSSGGIEEGWGPKDLPDQPNYDNGRLCARLAAGDLDPRDFGAAVRSGDGRSAGSGHLRARGAIPLGKPGLLVALLGMLFAVAGAAVETCMSNAYAIAQFFGWEWGRHKKPWEAPRFTLAWIIFFLLAVAIVLTGVDVMTLVEYAVLFSVVVLPLTYLPLMLLAGDKSYMGQYANKWLANGLGWLYFAIVTIAAAAAIPLYLLTSGGQA